MEKVRIKDKKGFLDRYGERMEDLGCFYGDYRIPPIEMNRLNSITHGTRNPTSEELEIIAETLEVSVNWLLYGGEYPELNWDDPALSRPTLLQFRKSHGLTQKALAAEMGVSPSKISKWENTEADQSVIDFIKERYGVEINKC